MCYLENTMQINRQDTFITREAALARWEWEGGSPAGWECAWFESDSGLEAGAQRLVLEYLGAALVSEWDELSRDVQKSIFQLAARREGLDQATLKARIARFLHDHKGDGRQP